MYDFCNARSLGVPNAWCRYTDHAAFSTSFADCAPAKVSLGELTSECSELGELFDSLDAFGDERLVDLQLVEGEALQLREGGVAGAEVVNEDLHTKIPELADRRNGRFDVALTAVSVTSTHSALGGAPVWVTIRRFDAAQLT